MLHKKKKLKRGFIVHILYYFNKNVILYKLMFIRCGDPIKKINVLDFLVNC